MPRGSAGQAGQDAQQVASEQAAQAMTSARNAAWPTGLVFGTRGTLDVDRAGVASACAGTARSACG